MKHLFMPVLASLLVPLTAQMRTPNVPQYVEPNLGFKVDVGAGKLAMTIDYGPWDANAVAIFTANLTGNMTAVAGLPPVLVPDMTLLVAPIAGAGPTFSIPFHGLPVNLYLQAGVIEWVPEVGAALRILVSKVLVVAPPVDNGIVNTGASDDGVPSLDELAGAMEFFVAPYDRQSHQLFIAFATSRAGYSWADNTVVRMTSDQDVVEVFITLQTPSGPPAYLIVETKIRQVVKIPAVDAELRIFLNVDRNNGTEPEFVRIR